MSKLKIWFLVYQKILKEKSVSPHLSVRLLANINELQYFVMRSLDCRKAFDYKGIIV